MDGHKINLDYILKNPKGDAFQALTGKTDKTGKPETEDMTVRVMLQTVLANENPNKALSLADKRLSGILQYVKLTHPDPLFTPEELAFMKARCEDACTSAVYYLMEKILDGKSDPLAE